MDYLVCFTLLVLVGSAWALPTDTGPQTPDAKPVRAPREDLSAKRSTRQQDDKHIIYLTPNQLKQLEDTQNEHGYIVPSAQSDTSLGQSERNKALGQQLQELLKQGQGSPSWEQQLQQQLEQQETTPSLQELENVLKKETDKQFQQKLLLGQSLEQQLIKQESNQSIAEQLQRQFWNEQATQAINFEQQLIKEAGENQKNEQKLLKQAYDSQQGQNRTETIEKEVKSNINQNLQQKYVVADVQNTKYKQLAPQLQFVPEQQQDQYIPQHLLRTPQLIYLDARREQAEQKPLHELRQVFYPEQKFIKFLQHYRPRPSLELQNQPKYFAPSVTIEPQPAIDIQKKFQQQIVQNPVKVVSQPELVQVQLQRQLRPQIELSQPQPATQLRLLKRPEPQLELHLRLQPELQLGPQPEFQLHHTLSEPQVKIQLHPQPKIQLHKFLEPQVKLQHQLKVEQGEINPEVRLLVDPSNKFERVPYHTQYIPDQQNENKQIGQELFKQQFQFLGEQSKLNAEQLRDSHQKLIKLMEQQELFGKEIFTNQIKLLQQEANRESEVLKKEIEKQHTAKVLKEVLKLNEEENIKPVYENQALLEDFLKNISNEQVQKESKKLQLLTHLDILRQQKELSQLQYTPRINES